ncbi:MAG: hypothetical protein ACRC9V_06120 [Aeromonas sp.]
MNKMLIKLADMLNGNARRRQNIKQRLVVAMMQTERHTIVAARAAKLRTAGVAKRKSLLHWRAEFHRTAV